MHISAWAAILLVPLSGCAAAPANVAAPQVEASILARSTPSNGSTVAGPVNNLQLIFARPARLLEVTVEGPDGLSPMMISSAGEVTDYSIPLPGLTGGAYRVTWRASAAGQTATGIVAFTVRD